MATLNAPKIPYRPKWPNDTQMSAAGVKIEEAKVRKCQLNSTQPFLWLLMTCKEDWQLGHDYQG
jgi:hypothetical protein